MALTHPYSGTETKAEEPIDEELFDLKVRENLEGLDTRVTALEGGGASGGGAAFEDAVGVITEGGRDNVVRNWLRRFSPFESLLNSQPELDAEGFDFEGLKKDQRWVYKPEYEASWSAIADASAYSGFHVNVAKDGLLEFVSKKGENFFTIGHLNATNSCDSVTVLIDGQTPTALGLKDENGDPATDTFSTLDSFFKRGVKHYFFGLDPEKEQVIRLVNTDSASKEYRLEFIEVGMASINPTLTNKITLQSGRAEGRHGDISFNKTELEFAKPTEGRANGHTGAVVATQVGLEALDGESPAMVACRPVNIPFSGVVTSLPIQNNFFFPSNGICMLHIYGVAQPHVFSYNGKTGTVPADHSLDSILWNTKPGSDFEPQSGFTGGTSAARGDVVINYLGTAPIEISATNNKVDFNLTKNGVVLNRTATIASGRYAADLMPLSKAFSEAMQAAEPIDGEYVLSYSPANQKWSVAVISEEVSQCDILVATGGSGNPLLTSLGFAASDLTGSTSYKGTTEVQHLSARVHERDKVLMSPNDPRIVYSDVEASNNTWHEENQKYVESVLGLPVRRMSNGGGYLKRCLFIHPEKDCTGLDITTAMVGYLGGPLLVKVDDGQPYYIHQSQNSQTNSNTVKAVSLSTFRISFPRGSKKVMVSNMRDDEFIVTPINASMLFFVGARQLFTKPAWEKLSLTKSIIKTVEVEPLEQWCQPYGFVSGNQYSPQPTLDQVDTITESVAWAANPTHDSRFGTRRTTAVNGNYMDIDFTIQGRGGFRFNTAAEGGGVPRQLSIYMNTQLNGITEGTDRMRNYYHAEMRGSGDNMYQVSAFEERGLPAGSYVVRIKLDEALTCTVEDFEVIDETIADPDKYTVNDLANTGMGIPYPYTGEIQKLLRDSADRVPKSLHQSFFKQGRTTRIEHAVNAMPAAAAYFEDEVGAMRWHNYMPSYHAAMSVLGNDYIKYFAFCKSMTLISQLIQGAAFNSSSQGYVDGRATPVAFAMDRDGIKGGLASPGATRAGYAAVLNKNFRKSCTHSAGQTFNINDTRGLRVDQSVLLVDPVLGDEEVAIIASLVVDTSFTVKKAPTVVTPADVDEVKFYGLHSTQVQMLVNDGAIGVDVFLTQPLPLTPSYALERMRQEFKTEVANLEFQGLANGADAWYPLHSDGNTGNSKTSSVSLLGKSAATSHKFPEDLKNIQVGAGTIDFKVKSTREVPVEIDERNY